ncbi:MAG: helix-turn-helix transcriptional regulator [Oscillospiraceae bacterium]|nr:helix-turn-helix transcriptional regulator [Oscillospiraceae bacterium]
MEFHEKLQELRKNKGMTQEELAKELFVSRTAISKWESGKGYPSIDSLKEISKFFSVTIDELLSSEELISAAKEENCTNIGKMTDLLIGLTDIMSLMLILLPLYPNKSGETVTAVALYQYTQISFWISCICWGMFAALIIIGAVKVFMNYKSIEKGRSSVTGVSLVLSIIAVLFLIAARIPYAAVMMFLLLIIKGILLFKAPKKDR